MWTKPFFSLILEIYNYKPTITITITDSFAVNPIYWPIHMTNNAILCYFDQDNEELILNKVIMILAISFAMTQHFFLL